MSVIPRIKISIKNKCNAIDVIEKTQPYSALNTGGWGSTNPDTNDITAANVKIYNHTTPTLLQTIDMRSGSANVYAGLQNTPTPGSFRPYSDLTWSQADGAYKVVYTVTIAGADYLNTSDCTHVLFLCNLCNCMEALVVAMATMCDVNKLAKYKEVYEQLEVYKFGIKTAFANSDFTKMDNLITSASALCTTFSDCGCGCGDC